MGLSPRMLRAATKTFRTNMADWANELHMLPPHMREGLVLYMQHGVQPGGFLYAVLTNDFQGAHMKADSINRTYLSQWAEYMHWYCPSICCGSVAKVEAWMKQGGLAGLQEQNNAASAEA